MRFEITITLDNSAFWSLTKDPQEYTPSETARILRKLADTVEAGEREGSLRDINGNKVGSFETID